MLHPFFAVPMIAIIVITALLQSSRLLDLTVVLCVFPLAAIFDMPVGDSVFSMTPPLLCAVLVPICTRINQRRSSGRPLVRETARVYLPLFCFTAFAVLSSYLIPTLLAGKFETAPAMD